MQLTEDELVHLGRYAEQLLMSVEFVALINLFRQDAMDHLLSTKPEDKEKRERIYDTQLALGEFVGLLQTLVQDKAKREGETVPLTFPVDPQERPYMPDEEMSDDEAFSLVDQPINSTSEDTHP